VNGGRWANGVLPSEARDLAVKPFQKLFTTEDTEDCNRTAEDAKDAEELQ
jgi:hypothetical protein